MAKNICTVVENGIRCPAFVSGRGMCNKHYLRWKKHGDPLVNLCPPAVGECSVQACPAPQHALTFCAYHYLRNYKYGEPGGLKPEKGTLTYAGVHHRLRSQFGNAREHSCADCGAQAVGWSYDHTDPDELLDRNGFHYSLDLSRYQPRCKRCHNVLDKVIADARAAS